LDSDFKISIRQSGVVHEGCRVNFPTTGGNLETSTVCLRESARRVFCLATTAGSSRLRSSRSSWWPHAQSGGQAKRHRSVPEISHENCHSPFKCAQDNSPRSPAQMYQMTSCSCSCCLKPTTSPVSLADKQPYRLQ